MAKNSRAGQAEILSASDEVKIRKAMLSDRDRMMFDIARFTGERWGAICQLRITDCYQPDRRTPLPEITFRASTRKKAAGQEAQTRQVPVHPTLDQLLRGYKPSSPIWMFPRSFGGDYPIPFSTAEKMFRRAVERAGLGDRGISTHSTRRTFITKLYNAGCDIKTLQVLTGHKDLKSLLLYVERSPERAKAAISLL